MLTEGPGALPYARIAAQLGTTEAAVQQAVRRLRKRYREALRARSPPRSNRPTKRPSRTRSETCSQPWGTDPEKNPLAERHLLDRSPYKMVSERHCEPRGRPRRWPNSRLARVVASELPARAPRGLCPRCLLRAGLDSEALSLSHAGEVGATVDLSGPHSVLETLAASVGPVPRVLLRDTDPGFEPPVTKPTSPEMPAPEDRAARLRLLGEIARGGMGAVLKGATRTWAATWPSRSCSKPTATSPT